MPEGDTIFRSGQTLHQALAGQAITRFETGYAHLARVNEDAPLVGRTVEKVEARGKHLLIWFSGDLVLHTHMRMHGSWHIYRPGEKWWLPHAEARVVVGNPTYVAVGFKVPVANFHTAASLAREPSLATLGPDASRADFDAEAALTRLRARPELEISEAVLSQQVMAGPGNVFKSEVLFASRIHPETRVGDLAEPALRQVVDLSHDYLMRNRQSRFRETTGRLNSQERLWVYGRSGQPCRACGAAIRFMRTGPHARVTYYCPACQPVAEPITSGTPPHR